MAVELTVDQADQIVNTDDTVGSDVIALGNFIAANGWNQVAFASRQDLPIPVWGKAYYNVQLLNPDGQTYSSITLIVFPDASGNLHFLQTTSAAEDAVAAQIDKPYYVSDPGSLTGDIANLLSQLNAMLAAAAKGAGSGLAIGTGALVLIGGLVLLSNLSGGR